MVAELSAVGGAAAVARSNIQAHERFGCARDGAVLFDADEFMYVEEEEKAGVPSELLTMFDAAWVDLDSDEGDAEPGWAGIVHAIAMASAFTGLAVTSDDLRRAMDLGYHRIETMTYLD